MLKFKATMPLDHIDLMSQINTRTSGDKGVETCANHAAVQTNSLAKILTFKNGSGGIRVVTSMYALHLRQQEFARFVGP